MGNFLIFSLIVALIGTQSSYFRYYHIIIPILQDVEVSLKLKIGQKMHKSRVFRNWNDRCVLGAPSADLYLNKRPISAKASPM